MAKRAIARLAPRRYFVRRSRKSNGFTIPLAVVAGFVPAGLDIFHATQDYGIMAGLDHLSLCTTGITTKPDGHTEVPPGSDPHRLRLPLLAGVLVHKLASKLGG